MRHASHPAIISAAARGMRAAPTRRLHPQAGLSYGPGGVCRYCGASLPAGRHWCWPGKEGRDCARKWKVRTQPAYAAHCVFARDRGVCEACGLDTVALKHWLETLRRETEHGQDRAAEAATVLWLLDWEPSRRRSPEHIAYWWPWSVLWRPLWQADHVVPVAEGGADLGLANLRTLCTPCHQRETRALRARMAFRRCAALWFARSAGGAA